MILSVPITSLVKIALESYEQTQGLAIMMGSGAEIERIDKTQRSDKVASGYKGHICEKDHE